MDGDQSSRVRDYRNQSQMLRLMPEQLRFLESRWRLLALTEGFEKLADHVETWGIGRRTLPNELTGGPQLSGHPLRL